MNDKLDPMEQVCAWISAANGHDDEGTFQVTHYGDDSVDVLHKPTGTEFRVEANLLPSQGKPKKIQPQILSFFRYDHLPPRLKEISKLFHGLAHEILRALPHNDERSVAFRKLLEAKDAAVRGAL